MIASAATGFARTIISIGREERFRLNLRLLRRLAFDWLVEIAAQPPNEIVKGGEDSRAFGRNVRQRILSAGCFANDEAVDNGVNG